MMNIDNENEFITELENKIQNYINYFLALLPEGLFEHTEHETYKTAILAMIVKSSRFTKSIVSLNGVSQISSRALIRPVYEMLLYASYLSALVSNGQTNCANEISCRFFQVNYVEMLYFGLQSLISGKITDEEINRLRKLVRDSFHQLSLIIESEKLNNIEKALFGKIDKQSLIAARNNITSDSRKPFKSKDTGEIKPKTIKSYSEKSYPDLFEAINKTEVICWQLGSSYVHNSFCAFEEFLLDLDSDTLKIDITEDSKKDTKTIFPVFQIFSLFSNIAAKVFLNDSQIAELNTRIIEIKNFYDSELTAGLCAPHPYQASSGLS